MKVKVPSQYDYTVYENEKRRIARTAMSAMEYERRVLAAAKELGI
jgi:hypothetical protein